MAGKQPEPTGFYGLADMPAEFQKAMDRTINHSKNTFCFLDDILIVSKGSEIEHGNLVEAVLKKLDEENLALKLSKYEFFKQEVNWLGHQFSEAGVRPKITKTEAVVNLNPPKLPKFQHAISTMQFQHCWRESNRNLQGSMV